MSKTPSRFKDVAVLFERIVLGGYLAAHGAQKLFGWFKGTGPEPVAAAFETIGLKPGRVTASAAGWSEFVGGTMIALGVADPLGPITVAATMAVASSTHLENGPFSAERGYELPLTNLAAAAALVATGPGRYSLDHQFGARIPRPIVRLAATGGVIGAAVMVSMVQRGRAERRRAAAFTPAPETSEQTAETGGGHAGSPDDGDDAA